MSDPTGARLGIEFTETMRGFFSTEEKDDYQRAAERGRRDGSTFEFTVTVAADDLDRFLDEPGHEARISGTVSAPALSDAPLTVDEGKFHLLVKDSDHPLARKMIYKMPMRAADGRVYSLE